jgi:hypothetical protein
MKQKTSMRQLADLLGSFQSELADQEDRLRVAIPYRWPQLNSLLGRLQSALIDAAKILEPETNQQTNQQTNERPDA